MSSIQTVYGTLATAFNTTGSTGGPANWQLPGTYDTPVRCMIDTYTPIGTEAAGSVIYLFTDGINKRLPQGANILKIDFIMSSTTSNLTCSVGDLNSATRYVSASTGFAGATAFSISGVVSGAPYIIGTNPNTAALGKVTNGDDQIILTTGGATLSASTSIISAVLYYTLTN
jgi:hypothetical protein